MMHENLQQKKKTPLKEEAWIKSVSILIRFAVYLCSHSAAKVRPVVIGFKFFQLTSKAVLRW